MCETYYDSEMDISSVSGRPVLPWPLDVLSLEANTPDHQRKVVSQGVRWARSVAYQSVERVTMPTHPEQDCRHSINIKVPRVYRTLPIAILEHSGRHPPDKCAVLRYLEPAILHVHRHPVASDACEQDLSDCENRWPSAAFKAIVFAPTERHSKVRYNKGIRIHAQHIVVLNSCLPFYWSYRDPIHLARFGFACHAYAELIMQSSHEVMYIVNFDVSNVWQSVLDDALVDVGLPGMRAAGCLGKGNDPREHIFAAIERLDPTRLTELRAKIRFLSLDEYRASKVHDASDEVLIEEAADRE